MNLYTTGEGEAPPAPLTDYSPEGCYTDSVADRALKGSTIAGDDMTIEKCSTTCLGYTWFGLEL